MKTPHFLLMLALVAGFASCKKDDGVERIPGSVPAGEPYAALRTTTDHTFELESAETYTYDLKRALSAQQLSVNAHDFANGMALTPEVRYEVKGINEDMEDMGFDNFDHSEVSMSDDLVFYSAYEPRSGNQPLYHHCLALISLNESQVVDNTTILEAPTVFGISMSAMQLYSSGIPAETIRRVMIPVGYGTGCFPNPGGPTMSIEHYSSEDALISIITSREERMINGIEERCMVKRVVVKGMTTLPPAYGSIEQEIDFDHTWAYPL
ncbi:MAG: hypothetical protein ACFB10_08475 [Salibacteraceae bacterium]